jgi:outer membrane protein
MRRGWIYFLAGAALVLALRTPLHAQTQPTATRVGFINSQAVVEAAPGYSKVASLIKQYNQEAAPFEKILQDLQPKLQSGNASATDRQDYLVATQALQKIQAKWQPQINAALQPIYSLVNPIIAKVAQQEGFQVIMDYNTARSLVVYAAPGSDITQAVIQALKQAH